MYGMEFFFYGPAIWRTAERAYSVTPVPLSISVSIWDGINNLRLSFLGVSNLHLTFSAVGICVLLRCF